MKPVTVKCGTAPVVLGMPHVGTWLPADVAANLNANGQKLADTDWHINRLYADLLPEATIVQANFHRYVIDANRDPDGQSLYPGQNTTTLVPLTDFDGKEIWQKQPTDADVAQRVRTCHTAYHAALWAELVRIHDLHGVAVLCDCHSIRGCIPYLFDDILPDFNIGTCNGSTCDVRIETAVAQICRRATGYTTVLNGRFKGGWTTRHYGRPGRGIHAIQMELAQSSYLASEAAPWTYDGAKADQLRPHLAAALATLVDLAPKLTNTRPAGGRR